MKKNKNNKIQKNSKQQPKQVIELTLTDKMVGYGLYGLWFFIVAFGLYSLSDPEWLTEANRENKKQEIKDIVHGGIHLSHQGKEIEAIEKYKEALSMLPDFTEASINLAVSYKRLKRYGDAINILHKAIAEDTLFAYAIYDHLTDIYHLTNKPDSADFYFHRSMESNPYIIEKAMKEGVYYFNLQNWGPALTAFEKAEKFRYDMQVYYHDMLYEALIRYTTNNPESNDYKIRDIRKILSEPFDENVFKSYDSTLFYQILNTDRGLAENYNKIGYVYAKTGNPDKSLGYFYKAVKIWPDYQDAISNIEYIKNKASNAK